MMGNTLTFFHYDNIIQNYQQLQMLLENKKSPSRKRRGGRVWLLSVRRQVVVHYFLVMRAVQPPPGAMWTVTLRSAESWADSRL